MLPVKVTVVLTLMRWLCLIADRFRLFFKMLTVTVTEDCFGTVFFGIGY
jgi:hypothetical protein